jgi:hypothetical protein
MQGILGFEEGYCSPMSANVSEEISLSTSGFKNRTSKKPAWSRRLPSVDKMALHSQKTELVTELFFK